MPELSRFYGIIVRMFFSDHSPPHFHAAYGEFELVVGIAPIQIMEGRAPNRVKSMVIEWTAMHQDELLLNWERCQNGGDVVPIDPLD